MRDLQWPTAGSGERECVLAEQVVGSFPRIDGEPDVNRLEAWLEAAVTARAIGDVFRDG
jgi:hypothetical protein